MAAKSEGAKTVAEQLQEAHNNIAQAMLAPDAMNPQVQQILQGLQQMIVQTVHALQQAKAQGGAGVGQQPQGQTMSAAPGQPGYGAQSPSGPDMAMAGMGAGGGDEMSRVLGPAGKGNIQ